MDKIEALKTEARQFNRAANWSELRRVIAELEDVWDDDYAALTFYNELEKDAPLDVKMWLESWDLHIHNDITTDCDCQEFCNHIYPVYVLSTFSDPSVGIFHVYLSPWFRSEEQVIEYIKEHHREIEKQIGD